MSSVVETAETIVTGVTITLTKEEAQILADLMTHVVGPDEGPRGFASRLWDQLNRAGYIGQAFPVNTVYGTDRIFILPRS